MSRIRVCVAGATGWAGSALALGVARSADLELVSAVSRTHAGSTLGAALGGAAGAGTARSSAANSVPALATPVYASVREALAAQPIDVLVEYTKPDVALDNVVTALSHGVSVVVGTSGLTDEDYVQVDVAALAAGKGVLAAGNFALTVVLLQKFAEAAAKLIPHWEIIDYAGATKVDAPSGTVRELAARLGRVAEAQHSVPVEETRGERATRGATMGGAQVHSVRLPGHTLGVEVVFGLADQRLSIRCDAGTSAEPYVEGALLAIRKVGGFVGLRRGLDTVLEGS